ncbi:rRNA N6-adenosine-methyltransferase METTL5 [Papilio machaon]|uniref:rRNA N6-adenosine-methyltransferase METTL5 n=1 Tax=Papilio machaon TaxID=76193 RepID=UPI001E665180|nr:rRNA N6-adenosine-methyltransferase METTL5 [Papilio machaon]
MSALLKLKVLEEYLQDLVGFKRPKIQYEQYETPSHIAAVALHTIQVRFEALENRLVLDAGCGPGVLALGASLLGANLVTGLDIDEDAINIIMENIDDNEITNVEVIQTDFLNSNTYRWKNYFDTVLMNPPFGTKNNLGMDMKFLQMGLELSCDSVYSLHKSSTRSHIQKKVKEWNVRGEVIAELRYDLPATYKFHKQASRDIAVDLWRLKHPHT